MSNREGKLIFSTDPRQMKCLRCGEFTPGCPCVSLEKITSPKGIVAKIRIEKAGRGGKAVTVIFDMPNDPEYLKDLTKKMKTQIGTGGTYKGLENTIEIQGDHRQRVKEILSKLGFQVKGV